MKQEVLAKYIITVQKNFEETNYADDRKIYVQQLSLLAVI